MPWAPPFPLYLRSFEGGHFVSFGWGSLAVVRRNLRGKFLAPAAFGKVPIITTTSDNKLLPG